jgi:hypothetical protein
MFQALTRFNHMGLVLSVSSKVRLQDEAVQQTQETLVNSLRANPLVKITGDNLDMYIKTGHQSTEKQHKDLHLFASNIMFTRIATPDLSIQQPVFNHESVSADEFIPHAAYKDTLLNSYCVLVGRIISVLPAFQWMKSVLPKHIHHPYLEEMSKPSEVHPLRIMMKNEAKLEDCVDIMDMYEDTLHDLFQKAFGEYICSYID